MNNGGKVVMVGPSGVGKTSIVTRLNGKVPHAFAENTIGCSFIRVQARVGLESELISFNVWDTAGQERYMSITPIYFRNADVVIFVFDVSDITSIDRMADFVELFLESRSVIDPAKLIFIGNKIDQPHPSEPTLIEIIKQNPIIVEYDLGRTDIVFVSATDNTNIPVLLQTIHRLLPATPAIPTSIPIASRPSYCCQH